jgi:hypothetical protein
MIIYFQLTVYLQKYTDLLPYPYSLLMVNCHGDEIYMQIYIILHYFAIGIQKRKDFHPNFDSHQHKLTYLAEMQHIIMIPTKLIAVDETCHSCYV